MKISDAWPLAPVGLPAMGLFNKLRPKFHAPVPLYEDTSFHASQTQAHPILPASFMRKAVVQFAKPTQYAGLSAASKNGCGATVPTFFPALVCNMSLPHALAKVCPPSVIM